MPHLTETFDQLKMSSEIQSSDHFPDIFTLLLNAKLLLLTD